MTFGLLLGDNLPRLVLVLGRLRPLLGQSQLLLGLLVLALLLLSELRLLVLALHRPPLGLGTRLHGHPPLVLVLGSAHPLVLVVHLRDAHLRLVAFAVGKGGNRFGLSCIRVLLAAWLLHTSRLLSGGVATRLVAGRRLLVGGGIGQIRLMRAIAGTARVAGGLRAAAVALLGRLVGRGTVLEQDVLEHALLLAFLDRLVDGRGTVLIELLVVLLQRLRGEVLLGDGKLLGADSVVDELVEVLLFLGVHLGVLPAVLLFDRLEVAFGRFVLEVARVRGLVGRGRLVRGLDGVDHRVPVLIIVGPIDEHPIFVLRDELFENRLRGHRRVPVDLLCGGQAVVDHHLVLVDLADRTRDVRNVALVVHDDRRVLVEALVAEPVLARALAFRVDVRDDHRAGLEVQEGRVADGAVVVVVDALLGGARDSVQVDPLAVRLVGGADSVIAGLLALAVVHATVSRVLADARLCLAVVLSDLWRLLGDGGNFVGHRLVGGFWLAAVLLLAGRLEFLYQLDLPLEGLLRVVFSIRQLVEQQLLWSEFLLFVVLHQRLADSVEVGLVDLHLLGGGVDLGLLGGRAHLDDLVQVLLRRRAVEGLADGLILKGEPEGIPAQLLQEVVAVVNHQVNRGDVIKEKLTADEYRLPMIAALQVDGNMELSVIRAEGCRDLELVSVHRRRAAPLRVLDGHDVDFDVECVGHHHHVGLVGPGGSIVHGLLILRRLHRVLQEQLLAEFGQDLKFRLAGVHEEKAAIRCYILQELLEARLFRVFREEHYQLAADVLRRLVHGKAHQERPDSEAAQAVRGDVDDVEVQATWEVLEVLLDVLHNFLRVAREVTRRGLE